MAWRCTSSAPMYTTHSSPSRAATVALATPCWPAPVSAMMRVLPMRFASWAWLLVLLILCVLVCLWFLCFFFFLVLLCLWFLCLVFLCGVCWLFFFCCSWLFLVW